MEDVIEKRKSEELERMKEEWRSRFSSIIFGSLKISMTILFIIILSFFLYKVYDGLTESYRNNHAFDGMYCLVDKNKGDTIKTEDTYFTKPQLLGTRETK